MDLSSLTKAYRVPRYLLDTLQFLLPPEDLTVSEWAARYRKLDSRTAAMPGPWLNDRTPYLREIMDSFSSDEIEEIVFCSCTQVGKSEAMNNMIGYAIQHDPGPMLIVYPTDETAEWTSENRIMPMVRACPTLLQLYDPLRSQKLELQFAGNYVALVGSNSPAKLASKPVRYLFLDELDKFPGASKTEADPISLAGERTKTFHNSKVFKCSSPSTDHGHIWKALKACDIEKHYFVPCPHCGTFIQMQFSNLRWPDDADGQLTYRDRAEQAHYVCQACGTIVHNYERDDMLRRGEWRIVDERSSVHKRVGYWMNTLYSPFTSFSEIALKFMESKDDPEQLQNFTNGWLGEPWKDTKLQTNADLVLERQTHLPAGVVPAGAKLLTAGVDVQSAYMYYTIRAWGNHATSQCISHGVVLSWAELDDVMNREYEFEDGHGTMIVDRAFIDSGYDTDAVYEYCVDRTDWAIPVKGASTPQSARYRMTTIDRNGSRAYGTTLCIVDTNEYKNWIAGRMKRPIGERGSWMVHSDCDREYAEQVTSEELVNEKSGHRTVQRWRLKHSHGDNHYLDCEVYAFAAADSLRIRELHKDDLPEQEPETADKPKSKQPNSWLGTGKKWI